MHLKSRLILAGTSFANLKSDAIYSSLLLIHTCNPNLQNKDALLIFQIRLIQSP
ncbi:Uncharacterized protein dnm_045690 [Desulfonema magnum]|uniref:Uncharacterized protein n=1 Tax=Desulfonema magnum TaxID=45655 RepID=A0A975BN13_9BACT|nr:Uncharacterized protein dnm_045690 [Desulfonema magnum]